MTEIRETFTTRRCARLRELTGHQLPGLPTVVGQIAPPFALATRKQIFDLVAAVGHADPGAAQMEAGQIIATIARSRQYLEAVSTDGSVRVDLLTGMPAGGVTDAERAHALAALLGPPDTRQVAGAVWHMIEERLKEVVSVRVKKALIQMLPAPAPAPSKVVAMRKPSPPVGGMTDERKIELIKAAARDGKYRPG